MKSPEVSKKKKEKLKRIYQSLNPAQLKRAIDRKLDLLYKGLQKEKQILKGRIPKRN